MRESSHKMGSRADDKGGGSEEHRTRKGEKWQK